MNIIKITGGKTRQKSTLKALKKFKNKNFNKVLIHDVARPNPTKKMIKNMDIPTQLAIKDAGINLLSKMVEEKEKREQEEAFAKRKAATDKELEAKRNKNKSKRQKAKDRKRLRREREKEAKKKQKVDNINLNKNSNDDTTNNKTENREKVG